VAPPGDGPRPGIVSRHDVRGRVRGRRFGRPHVGAARAFLACTCANADPSAPSRPLSTRFPAWRDDAAEKRTFVPEVALLHELGNIRFSPHRETNRSLSLPPSPEGWARDVAPTNPHACAPGASRMGEPPGLFRRRKPARTPDAPGPSSEGEVAPVRPADHGQDPVPADGESQGQTLALMAWAESHQVHTVDSAGAICFALRHGDDLQYAGSQQPMLPSTPLISRHPLLLSTAARPACYSCL
jgi:hypothetical protein